MPLFLVRLMLQLSKHSVRINTTIRNGEVDGGRRLLLIAVTGKWTDCETECEKWERNSFKHALLRLMQNPVHDQCATAAWVEHWVLTKPRHGVSTWLYGQD